MNFQLLLRFGIVSILVLSANLGRPGAAQERNHTPVQTTRPAQADKPAAELPEGVGVVEVPRADGGRDKIYSSTISPEEEAENYKAEKEKIDRSWEMLKNVIIDKRTR